MFCPVVDIVRLDMTQYNLDDVFITPAMLTIISVKSQKTIVKLPFSLTQIS
jgi:hypothetical protein